MRRHDPGLHREVVAPLQAVARLVAEDRLGAVATVVAGAETGARGVADFEEGWVVDAIPTGIAADVLADARSLMEFEQSRTLVYGGLDVFIETVAPRPRLIVFGAVDTAQALASLAGHLGFHVTVSDSRPAFTTPERFPGADEVLVGWPDDIAERLVFDRRTFVVILSHDSRFEEPVFAMLHEVPVRYIGAMGSRRTHAKRVEGLQASGWTEEEAARIHGPVGLDIGAETPAEVAVSILAEMIQVRYGSGTGLSLRGRTGRVHLQRQD